MVGECSGLVSGARLLCGCKHLDRPRKCHIIRSSVFGDEWLSHGSVDGTAQDEIPIPFNDNGCFCGAWGPCTHPWLPPIITPTQTQTNLRLQRPDCGGPMAQLLPLVAGFVGWVSGQMEGRLWLAGWDIMVAQVVRALKRGAGGSCVYVWLGYSQWRVAGEVRQLREYGVTRRHTHIDWTHRGMGEQLVSWLFSC